MKANDMNIQHVLSLPFDCRAGVCLYLMWQRERVRREIGELILHFRIPADHVNDLRGWSFEMDCIQTPPANILV